MRNFILVLPLALSAAACDHKPMHDTVSAKAPTNTTVNTPPLITPSTNNRAPTDPVAKSPSKTDTMNTAVNERDRTGATTTPIDQSNSKVDIDHVAEIRKALVGDDQLSMSAQNVKIMTSAGVVTLRGTVPTALERARIEELARKSSATTSVVNQIEVETK
ncbi:MAG: BON domain-containing protein [Planctomycetota bacterium]|nr:BON domain-containing protein [Planctomycetota bacterium]